MTGERPPGGDASRVRRAVAAVAVSVVVAVGVASPMAWRVISSDDPVDGSSTTTTVPEGTTPETTQPPPTVDPSVLGTNLERPEDDNGGG